MATSGTLQLNPNTYTTDGAPNRADINWSATWNSSTLQWSVSWNAVAAGNTNSYWVTIFSGTVTFTDANGNVLDTKSMAAQVPKARGGDQLLSGSFVVGVDSLGNQTLNISGRFQIEYNGSGSDNAGTSKGTGSYALDQMAMASTFTVTSSTVGASGGASTVSISRRSPSYTHSVTWTFGSYTHTETGVGTSVTYTIPASWLNAIPNSATGVGAVTVQTYNGSTPIGSAATAQFSVTAAVNPSIGSFTSAPRGAAYNAQITNYQTVYVSGYSTALLTASSVAGAYGSTITKYEFLQNNALIAQYSRSASSYSHTTGTLSGTSIVLSARVTDSRGKQATANVTVTLKSYATPALTSANAYRCDSSGTATNDGTYIKVEASAVATPSENSIVSLTYATKATSAGSYGVEANIGSGVIAPGFANTTSYDVRIKATDKLGQSSYRYFTIPTAEYTMDFKVGGKGVAFGKVAETDELVDSAWAIRSAGHIEAGDGLTVKHTGAWGNLNFQQTTDATRGASLSTETWGDSNRIYFNEFHRANDVNSTSYVDTYNLPYSGKDNASHVYDILTTKGYDMGNFQHPNAGNQQYQEVNNSGFSASTSWQTVPNLSLSAPVTGLYAIEALAAYNTASPNGLAIITRSASSGYNDYRAIVDRSASGLTDGTTQYLNCSCVAWMNAGDVAIVRARYVGSGSSNFIRLRMCLL